jgi:hypothetical protein
MAKRKAKPAAGDGQLLVEVTLPVVEDEQGGIFLRRKVVGEKRETVTVDELRQMAREITDNRSLESELVRVSSNAAATIRPHAAKSTGDAEAPGRRHYSYDLGDGKRIYSLPEHPTEEVATAQRILADVEAVRLALRRGTEAGALEIAYELGRMAEHLIVLPHEADGQRGKDVGAGLRSGPNARSDKAKTREMWVRREYAAALTADPKDKAKARRKVLKAFPIAFPGDKPISESTIERYVATKRAPK